MRGWRDLVERYAFAAKITAGVLIGAAILGLGASSAWDRYQHTLYQGEYGPELQAEFGFDHASAWIQAGDEKVEVFTIHPFPGGYMDKIGFKDGNIIISCSITEFYKMLYTERGRPISVDLVEGGDGLPIESRKIKTIQFLVPVSF